MSKVEKQLRSLLNATPESLTAIGREAGLSAAQMSLFARGLRHIGLRNAERLAAVLKHELTLKKVKAKKTK